MLLIASSSGCTRSGTMSRPASYCRSIARSMSASARSASRSFPDTGTANVSPGASMRAFAAMASIRASRSSALTRGPLIESDNSEASTHRLPAAYPAFFHAQSHRHHRPRADSAVRSIPDSPRSRDPDPSANSQVPPGTGLASIIAAQVESGRRVTLRKRGLAPRS